MSIYSPYTHYAGITERKPGLVDLQIRNLQDVRSWRVWASSNLNNIYGNPDGSSVAGDETARKFILEVQKNNWYVSPSCRRWRGTLHETIRGIARALFNVHDFIVPASPQPLPTDEEVLFVRLQQNRLTTGPITVTGGPNDGDPVLGPILIVPTATFFGILNPIVTAYGTAPTNTNGVAGKTPLSTLDLNQQVYAPPMAIVFPRPTSAFNLTNLTNVDILYSYGWEFPYAVLPANGQTGVQEGSIKELIIASRTTVANFSLEANIMLGTV